MGHQYGDSPQFHDAIMAADKQISKIWNALKEREEKYNEDWLIVITTDHGRGAETGKNHGGQSDRERSTWIVTNAKARNEYFNQHPGVVDILPSICYHMNVPLPEVLANEIDGVSFIGPIDFANLRGAIADDTIKLQWDSFSDDAEEKVEFFVSETNLFKTGGIDTYYKAGEASVGKEKFNFKPSSSSEYYKIVAASSQQRINVWIVH